MLAIENSKECNSVLLFLTETKIKSVQKQLHTINYIEQHVSKDLSDCEPENDLNRSKHVVLFNKWYVVVFGRILS
jgi:hypothetical protein